MKIAYKAHPDSVQEDLFDDPSIFTRAVLTEPVRCMVDSRTLFAAEIFIGAQRGMGEPDPSIEIKHTLNLASDISINYVVPAQQLEGCTDIFLYCRYPRFTHNFRIVVLKREPL